GSPAARGPGIGPFAASDSGVLIYQSGSAQSSSQLTWFDRSGTKLDTVGTPGVLQGFALSRDDTALVVARADAQDGRGRFDLWIRDLVRGPESRLTSTGSNSYPVFSADGTQIFFDSLRDGTYKIYKKLKNGTGPDEVVETAQRFLSDASSEYLFTATST